MSSGLTSAYVNGLMVSPSTMPDLDAANTIAVVLWAEPADAPDVTDLQTIATATYAGAQAAWGAAGGIVNDDSHVFYLTYVAGTTATASAYVFDATDPTTMTTPALDTEACDISIWHCPTAATVANLGLPLAYFDLGAGTVIPNDQNIIVDWNVNGIWQFGAAV